MEHLRRYSAAWSIIIGAAMALFCAGFLPIYFSENDDVVMMMLVSGVYNGDFEPFLVYQNIYFSTVIANLYMWMPHVPWYPLTLVFLSSLSLATTSLSILQKNGETTLSTLLVLVALVLVYLVMTVELQYTTVAGALGAAAAAAIYLGRSVYLVALGVLLACLGAMVRFEACALAALLVAPVFVFGPVRGAERQRAVIASTIAIIAAVVLHFAGDAHAREAYASFLEFDRFRAAVTDINAWVLSNAQLPNGISQIDYALLRDFFPDIALFGEDARADIVAELSGIEENFGLGDWLKGLRIWSSVPLATVTLAIPVLFCLTAARWRARALYAAISVLVLTILTYLEVTAVVKERIIILALAAILTGVLMSDLTDEARPGRWLRTVALTILPIFFMNSFYEWVRENGLFGGVYAQQMDIVEAWTGRVVVYRNHLVIQGVRPFSQDIERLREKVTFAGWLTSHPANTHLFGSHQDLLTPGTALLVNRFTKTDAARPVEALELALEKNYGAEVKARQVAEHPFAQLYVLEPVE